MGDMFHTDMGAMQQLREDLLGRTRALEHKYTALRKELQELMPDVGSLSALCNAVHETGKQHSLDGTMMRLLIDAKQMERALGSFARDLEWPGLLDVSRVPILFLDIDGVLNCSTTKERLPGGQVGIEQEKLKLLLHIQQETGCRIVLSSNWRHNEELCRQFWLALDEWPISVLDYTPVLSTQTAGGLVLAKTKADEIRAWIEQNRYNGRFVIVDDEVGFEDLEPWVVSTVMHHGLTRAVADMVIEKFGPIIKRTD